MMTPSQYLDNLLTAVKKAKKMQYVMHSANFCTRIPDYARAFKQFFGDMSKVEGIARVQEVLRVFRHFIIVLILYYCY